MKRVPPSIRLKEEINGLLQGTASTGATPEEPPMVGGVGRLARYMLQVAMEAEATSFLGRGHCRRVERQRVGWRKGYGPKQMQSKMQGRVQQVFGAPTYATALKRGRDLIVKFKDRYPAAMECLERDLEECITYLRFPEAHHTRIRTTNRLERLNGESRRRTKVIPRFPTERSCLSLLYASLITASKHWRGIPMTVADVKQLQQLRAAIAVPTKEGAVA